MSRDNSPFMYLTKGLIRGNDLRCADRRNEFVIRALLGIVALLSRY